MKTRSIHKLNAMLKELESSIQDRDIQVDVVSSASIGWHVDHSLMVIEAIVEATKSSNPEKFKKKFNFAKFYVFTLGKIPHKKGRAPKAVTPTAPASSEKLEQLIQTAQNGISSLPELYAGKFFKHPIFGNLRLNDTIRFLELHTEHHLKIIRSIRNEAK